MYCNPAKKEIVLGSAKDFESFLKPINPFDKATLRTYWRIATLQKRLLLIHKNGPHHSQVCIIPLDVLPTLKDAKVNMKYSKGFVGISVKNETYFVFGADIQETGSSEKQMNQPVHVEQLIPKKRGRKKGVGRNGEYTAQV